MLALRSVLVSGGLCAALAAQPSGFPTYPGMVTTMTTAANNHPSICQLIDVTVRYGMPTTLGGNHIYALRISDNVTVEEDEPAFLMVSAHHGNEYGTPIVALDAIERLTTGYGVDPTITALVDDNEIWIAPCWNPDGYWTSRQNNNNVDLNRNYPFLWGSPCNTGVKGPSPASEIETQTMIALSEDQRFAKVLDYHSSGRETLYGYRQACGNHVFSAWYEAEATMIAQASGYGGQTREPSSNGEHYQYQMGAFSNYAFLTEISNTQSPTIASAQAEATQLWPGTVAMLQRAIPVQGHVTDLVTGQPIEASISYVENPFTMGEQNHSEPTYGRYHAFLPAGPHTLRFEAPGYQPELVPVTVSASGSLVVDVQLTPPGLTFTFPNGLPSSVDPAGGTTVQVAVSANLFAPQPGTGRVTVDSQNGPLTMPMLQLSPNLYEAMLPGFVCDDTVTLRFAAEDTGGQPWQSEALQVPTAIAVNLIGGTEFEVPSGWTGGLPGDTATTGIWNRMDPFPTAAQPGDDHTPTGVNCWVTDGNGGSLGQYDVDNGFTTLLSPALDFTAEPNASVRYWRWYSNDQNGQTDDELTIDVSDDNGATWVNAETIDAASGQASGGWFEHTFRIADFVQPTAQVRIRVVAADQSPGSIVEAAFDDFEIFEVLCDGEVVRGGVSCADSTLTQVRLQPAGSMHPGDDAMFATESGTTLPSYLFAGFRADSWNGVPLPVAIPDTFGCSVSISPDVVVGTIPNGQFLPVPIPNTPAAAGLTLFWQSLLLDPGLVSPLQVATSDRIATTIGS